MSEMGGAPAGPGTDPSRDPEGAEMTELGNSDAFAAERERLEGEVATFKDKFLRAFAEAENVRRRADKEVADARSYGISAFARDVLNVADDLGRALDALEPEAKAKAEGTVKSLIEGLELTERSLQKALEKHGVRKLEPKGERFNPNHHQAMFEVPDESVPTGTVVQVVQSGYVIGDRVLRPAMVGVSRGGPKLARDADAQQNNG